MDYAKAEKIRELYFIRNMKPTELAKMFGIAQGSVSRIVSGRVWQTPPAP
jgi:DNA-directed RNA polymerase specialized sigma subunit